MPRRELNNHNAAKRMTETFGHSDNLITLSQALAYKSDIDASLVEATAVMSRLLSNAAFLEQLEKARKEYARLRTLFLPHRG